LKLSEKQGNLALNSILKERNVQSVSFSDWKLIDDYERKRGHTLGKPREKIFDLNEFLSVLNELKNNNSPNSK